jgi:hypothetical protein
MLVDDDDDAGEGMIVSDGQWKDVEEEDCAD